MTRYTAFFIATSIAFAAIIGDGPSTFKGTAGSNGWIDTPIILPSVLLAMAVTSLSPGGYACSNKVRSLMHRPQFPLAPAKMSYADSFDPGLIQGANRTVAGICVCRAA